MYMFGKSGRSGPLSYMPYMEGFKLPKVSARRVARLRPLRRFLTLLNDVQNIIKYFSRHIGFLRWKKTPDIIELNACLFILGSPLRK